MNRQKTLIYGQTANTAGMIYLQLLVVMHYLVMYTITVKNQYTRGAKMDKKEAMAEIKNLPVEEKYKLLSDTDKAYIRGFIDCLALEQIKTNSGKTKTKTPKRSKKQ